MDWPKFEFCVLLWVLCVSKALGDSTALKSLPESGGWGLAAQQKKGPWSKGFVEEPECQWGDILPRRDECNTCICFEGNIHCTNLPCRKLQQSAEKPCWEGTPSIKLDECNECICSEGKLDCSDLICIRGSKCTEGQEIARPDYCNICKCFEGHIVCTNYECNPRSKHRPWLTANATTEVGALKDTKECEENDFIPPPPPPFDCNKCVCLNRQVFCSMESCSDDVPDMNTRFNLKNEPKDNLEAHDKKISVDPYLNLFYKNYDKTPTKLVHTHAYNGFHQEIKVHSKNLSQDTSKLIKALASSLDNPVLGQIGDRLKSSSPNINNHEPTKLSGGQGVQNNIPNSPYSNEIQAKHSPNLSDHPLHSLSSLITSGSQSNETILVIPTKQKPFAANQQPALNTPYSSESGDLTFEQKNPFYPANHPSNFSPRDHYKTFDSRNKDLINQSPLPIIPMNSEKNNGDKQFSAPYTLEDELVSPSDSYKFNQGQHPDNLNKYSNTSSSHPMYHPSHEQLKYPSNDNVPQYAQPHTQLGPDAAYRPYQNEPIHNSNHNNHRPNHNNHYPISNHYNPVSPSQYQFDQNHTNPFGHQNILSDQDGNYPRHPYKLNPINHNHYQMDPSQNSSGPVVGSDKRGTHYSPLYSSVEQNPANYNANHINAPTHDGLRPESQHQPTSTPPSHDKYPTQMRLPEKEVLSLQDINYNSKYNSKLKYRPSLYNIHPSKEPNNGVVHSQESNRPHLTGYDFTQNSFKPEQEKNVTILDDNRQLNLPHPQFEPNPMYYQNQQFTSPHNSQSDQNYQQPRSPYEPNQNQTNTNIYQTHYPNSPENIHQFGEDDHTQHNNAHLQENLPQFNIGPNQEERSSTLDNNGNRYNVTNSHYKTHSSLTYVTQYVPTHQDKTSDQSPSTSNLDDRFNLHHPYPNSVELNGRGKGPNTEYNTKMNLIKPGFLSIQRENEVDPTIVKVYQYLNQPKNIYPPNQNENYPHSISDSLLTNDYPALNQENLEYTPRSSMSVEDDKNGKHNSAYSTSLHSQSPMWGSRYRDKDKKPVSYPISSPSFYSGPVDNNIDPNNNSSHAHHIPEDSQLSSRYYTPSDQTAPYDKNKVPFNKSSYANHEPEELAVPSRYKKLSVQRGQHDKNKAHVKNSPEGDAEDILVGSKYNPPSFQIGQYDENKTLITNNRPRYAKDMLVGSKYNPSSFKIGQYDENKNLIKNGQPRYAKGMLVGSKYKPSSFKIGQYDENKNLIKNGPPRYSTDMLVGSKHNLPSFETGQFDENKALIKNSPKGDAEDMLIGSKYYLPSSQTGLYGKNSDRFNDSPYSHDNIMQPDASPVSSHHTPPLFDSVHYEDNKVPISYNQYVHNDSQPETSPIRPHQKTPLFNLLQYVKKRIPHSYSRNYSKPETQSSKWDLDYYKKIFPLDYDPFAHNISQPEASPVVSHDKSPLLHASPYDKSKVPISYDPSAQNLSQTEGSLINSHYPPYLTPIPDGGTALPNNKNGLKNQIWEVQQSPLPTWGKNNISQPEAFPVNSNEKNNIPMNYNPSTNNIPETKAYPSNSRNPTIWTPIPYNGTGALLNKYGLTEEEENPLPTWGKDNQPQASPVNSHDKSPLFYNAHNEIHNFPFNYDPRANNLSQIEAYPSNSNFTPVTYDANGAPMNTYGLKNHVPEVNQNHLPYPSNFKPIPFDANGKPLNLYGLTNNSSEVDQNHLPYKSNFKPIPFDANGKPLNLYGLTNNSSEVDQNHLPYKSNFKPIPFDANGKPLNLYGLTNNGPEGDQNHLPYPSNFKPIPFDANGKPLNLYGLTNNGPEGDQNHLPYPSNFKPIPFDANGKPLNLYGITNNVPAVDHNYLNPWEKNNISQTEASPSKSRYPSNFTPFPHDGTGVPIQYGQTNHIPEEEQVSPWTPKNKHTVPIYEQVKIDDIILPETNDNISTSSPLDLTDQQDQLVHDDPSQQQPQTGNFNDHGPVNEFQYISNSAKDPNNSFNKANKSETNSPQQPDASVLEERGSLDGFQYISPSDEYSDTPKLNETNSLSVIPHKNKYANYSPYPEQIYDPRSQFELTQNTPVGVNHPGSQKEPLETDAFDDRGAHDGFQYISISGEESQNKPDHGQFKPTSSGKLDNGLYPPSFSNKDKYSPSPKQESTANPGNDKPIIVDVDSINPDILKLLENPNKPLSIEDLINELDSHKHPQLKPNNDSSIPTGLSDDDDQLQSRFNDLFLDSFPQLQTNKKIVPHPPIDDSELYLGDLDPLELLRLLFPFKFNHAPGKNTEQVPLKDKDMLALLLGNQNFYNLTKNKKVSYNEQYSVQLPNDNSKNSTKKNKTPPQGELGQPANHVDPRNKGKEVDNSQPQQQTTMQEPKTGGQAQNPPLQKQTMQISDESLNFPPIQYPDVHIILHHNIGESNALPYMETDVDGDDFFPSLLHSRIKKPKEQIAECGENTKWVRNCHACSCRRGKASCSKIPDCVFRILEEPMMCKPYSKFKMGCYSCECTGDGIPDCDALDCEIEAKNKESQEDTSEKTPHVYHEFFEDVKAKTMLSYYTFFKKLPKDSSEELNYPTCEAGTQWVSNCHNCECKDSLKHECTKIEDCKLDLESLGKPGKCKPNSKFYPKSTKGACQQCSCDDEGNPSCPSADQKKL